MLVKFISLFLCAATFGMAASVQIDESDKKPAADATENQLVEADLLGLYIQAGSGTLLEFKPEGKLGGWPAGGTYKITGKNRVELLQSVAGKEERLPLQVFREKEGLIIVRNVNGQNETVPLHRLDPVKLEAKAWEGECMIHVLISGEKLATKREAIFKDDGYVRTPEGGYWLRLLKDKDGEHTLGFTSELADDTLAIHLYKTGPLLVLFDRLEKPKLMSIIQLSVK